ncbi:MAG: DUF547 domain-containing protein [Bacteroidota bacterium]
MKSLLFCTTAALCLCLLGACSVKTFPSTSQPINHVLWDSLLKQHVDANGWVDYQGFVQDSSRLNQYLSSLSAHHPNEANWSREQRLAYWINAYNAFTVQLMIRHHPVESIKDIKNGIPFVNSVWDIAFIQIEGATYDLNNIEHSILRKRFSEPRIHFAINCASYSCPVLLDEAYTADQIEEQLDRQARLFLSDQKRNVIEADKIRLSKIFKWFKGDFTDGQTLIEFLNRYSAVQIQPKAKLEYLDYNWTVNSQAKNSTAL